MSRFSIAILVIIILGFVMTVKRDQPQETPTINTAVDKSKQPPQTADKKKPTTQTVTPAQPPVTPVVTKEPEKVLETPKTAEIPAVIPTVKTEVAPTTPPVTQPPAIDTKILESGEALSRATQQELSRLGCFTGNVNQRWGADGREAIKRFNTSARFAWPDWPSPDLVASMQRYPADFCKKCRNGGDCSNPADPNKTQTVSVEPQKTTPEAPKTTTPPPVETPKTTVAPVEPPKTTVTPAEPPKVSTTTTPTTPPGGETSSPPGDQASRVESLPEKTEEPSYLPPSVKKRQERSNREEQANEEEADQPTPRRNQRRVEEPRAESPAKKVRPRSDEDNSRARAEQRYRERYERADRNDYDRPVWIRPRDEPRPRRRYYERDYDDWDMRPSGGGR